MTWLYQDPVAAPGFVAAAIAPLTLVGAAGATGVAAALDVVVGFGVGLDFWGVGFGFGFGGPINLFVLAATSAALTGG